MVLREAAVDRRGSSETVLRAHCAFAGFLLVLRLADGGQALAGLGDAVASRPIDGVERLARGASFDAGDLLTWTTGSLSKPRFDASAGTFGSGGFASAAAMPDTLSGSYVVRPAARELSASVMVADSQGGTDGFSTTGYTASGNEGRFSPGSTAAAGSRDPAWGRRVAGGSFASVAAVEAAAPVAASPV